MTGTARGRADRRYPGHPPAHLRGGSLWIFFHAPKPGCPRLWVANLPYCSDFVIGAIDPPSRRRRQLPPLAGLIVARLHEYTRPRDSHS